MKKLFAFALAATLLVSMNAFSFAIYEPKAIVSGVDATVDDAASGDSVAYISADGFLEKDGLVNMDPKADAFEGHSNTVQPGKVIYIPLINKAGTFVNDSDAVKSVQVKATYILGKEAVESVKVVYKKYEGFVKGTAGIDEGDENGYAYFVAITARDSATTSSKDISFDLELKKTSGKIDDETAVFTLKARIDLACSFPRMGYTYVISSGTQVYEDLEDSGEQTFTFSRDSESTFDVDITGQDRILVRADVKFNPTVAAKYPQANLDFFTGSGTFNRIGTLNLHADPGSFLYVVNNDGTLSKSNAEYDDGAETFVIKTRTLGSYVISDVELNVSAASSTPSAPASEPASAPTSEPQAPILPPSSIPQATGGVPSETPKPGATLPTVPGLKPNPNTGVAA